MEIRKKKKFTLNSETSKPISNYAASKKSSEVLLYAFSRLNNINVTVLRFFTVYGPMGRPDMSPFIFIESNIRRKKISLLEMVFKKETSHMLMISSLEYLNQPN